MAVVAVVFVLGGGNQRIARSGKGNIVGGIELTGDDGEVLCADDLDIVTRIDGGSRMAQGFVNGVGAPLVFVMTGGFAQCLEGDVAAREAYIVARSECACFNACGIITVDQ